VEQLTTRIEAALQDHKEEWEQLKHDVREGLGDALTGAAPGATYGFLHGEMSFMTWALVVGGGVAVGARKKAIKAYKLARHPLYVLHKLS